jgi:hypothetical protein
VPALCAVGQGAALVACLATWIRGLLDVATATSADEVELTAVVWAAPEGGFTALNPETGTTSEGETQAEALSNLVEANALYLEAFPLPLGERPVVTTFHIAEVA